MNTSYDHAQPSGRDHEEDLSEWNGELFTKNKKGLGLCDDFQKGRCEDCGPDNTCWFSSHLTHQCAYCLKAGHGADDCWANPANKNKFAKGGRKAANDKGRGKGGGVINKGGKHGRGGK